jgi:hypothetical protein
MVSTQGVLFSEPAYSETGVWCELSPGIDPAEWAGLCRKLGTLPPKAFHRLKKKLSPNPDRLTTRINRLFVFEDRQVADVPLLCFGPEGLRRQKE